MPDIISLFQASLLFALGLFAAVLFLAFTTKGLSSWIRWLMVAAGTLCAVTIYKEGNIDLISACGISGLVLISYALLLILDIGLTGSWGRPVAVDAEDTLGYKQRWQLLLLGAFLLSICVYLRWRWIQDQFYLWSYLIRRRLG